MLERLWACGCCQIAGIGCFQSNLGSAQRKENKIPVTVQEERLEFFKAESELAVLPGKGNFFRGRATSGDSAAPGHSTLSTASMLRAVRTFYDAWSTGSAEPCLSGVASKQLHVLEPIWQEVGEYLPVNRVEAAMWIERQVKNAGGELHYEPKVLSRAQDTNLVRSHLGLLHCCAIADACDVNCLAI